VAAVGGAYAGFVTSPVGRKVAAQLGLPRPVTLRRYAVGAPLVDAPVLVGGLGDAPVAARARALLGAEGVDTVDEVAAGYRVGGVIADLTAATDPTDLDLVRTLVAPALKGLQPSGRVILVGRTPSSAGGFAQAATRRALEGITRSIGKELRAGATANLVLVGDDADDGVDATLRFLLSGRSAYVDGQVVRVGALRPGVTVRDPEDWAKPLQGKVAVVTGAARGIGASIADVLSRDGATVVCVDIAAAGEALARTANRVGGTALQLDVTAADAGQRILEHANARHGGLDIVVHNAGITRDKLLANMTPDKWDSVLAVNIASQLRINEALLTSGDFTDAPRIVSLASTSGIAGNRGQTNYAASKGGVIGMVRATAPLLEAFGGTANAVAPGFIETEMTARIPAVTRQVARRLNSLQQGGLPVDVAETVAFLASPAAGGIVGRVLRVCGQNMVGQ
jgi:3-oxoacyl-[acyl-carrier protein] reductase